MNLSMILYLVAGAAAGAALGYFTKCSSGTCPLVANWRRGAVLGAGIGVAAFFMTGGGSAAAMNESTANVKHVGQAEFDAEVVQSTSPVLVDFYATWCGPCRTLSPRVEKIAGEFAGKVKFVKVNVDESPGIAQRFEIQALPTLLLFKNGGVTNTVIGLQSEADLRTLLREAANAAADR